jgi:hypothetical protein
MGVRPIGVNHVAFEVRDVDEALVQGDWPAILPSQSPPGRLGLHR